jgi:hypothetical protein
VRALNEILDHLNDDPETARFRRHDVGRYIQYLSEAPLDEVYDEETQRYLDKLFQRCSNDNAMIQACLDARKRASQR